MLPPWLPDFKQFYPHGCRIINNVTSMAAGLKTMLPRWLPNIRNNVTPMAAGLKTMLSPWLPDYKQCYPHGCRIMKNVTPMAAGL